MKTPIDLAYVLTLPPEKAVDLGVGDIGIQGIGPDQVGPGHSAEQARARQPAAFAFVGVD